jgi:uncharacterized protein (DUF2147 family)
MKKKIILLFTLLTAFITVNAQVSESQILGEWLSSKKDSRVLIYKQRDKYYGKIIWGTGGSTKDVKNPKQELRNTELVGLVILSGFKFNGDDMWEDGTIYDPREGKTYSCKMTLNDASELSIRGYVGISLFGRSEVWTKYNNKKIKQLL